MKRFLIGYALLTTCLLFMQGSIKVTQVQTLLVYHVDNQGSGIKGIVSDKKKIGSLYTVTINDNVFVINEQKYQKIKIGDEVEI
jgi:hypothetical protein|nr:MAG TPA: Protein of unknown function (DUF1372) [Caudoviricetes sp.]